MIFRLLFVLSTSIGRALKVKAVYIIIDFFAVGICAVISGVAMILLAQRIAFYLCVAIVMGFVLMDLMLDFMKIGIAKHFNNKKISIADDVQNIN